MFGAGVLSLCAGAAWSDEISAAGSATKTQPKKEWTVGASLTDHMQGDGLPVAALGKPDWYVHADQPRASSRADRRIQVSLGAEHATGWRVAAVGRAQATVEASADAVALAVALESRRFPLADRLFTVWGQSQGWRGEGIELGTPWMPLGVQGWQWQAEGQWLQLSDWRRNNVSGAAAFLVASQGYDAHLSASRSGLGIRGPFLGSSGKVGMGMSVSVALRGQWTPQVAVRFRGQDVLSRLRWSRMASEQLTLNTQVAMLRPDGLLDYEPAVKGVQSVGRLSRSIGRAWYAELDWQLGAHDVAQARAQHVGGMWSTWLLWQRSLPAQQLRWTVGVEPRKQAVKLRADWRGAYLEWAGDGRGKTSEIGQVGAGVRFGF